MRLCVLLALLPAPLAAHPHIFIDATVEVQAEAGAVTGVRLVWTYDDLFSLFLTEDLGIDGDGDLVLTEGELSALQKSVSEWPADFEGDLEVTAGDGPLPLGPREDHVVAFEGGRVIESHRRPLGTSAPATEAPVVVRVFDPSYYVAYTVTAATVTGDASCQVQLIPVDMEAAQAEVDATWAGLDWANAPPDTELPPIGGAFADRIEVRCGA